jgi:hypothetical protein
MKAVIEIIKRYLVEILCGVAGIGGLVFIFLGLGKMGAVKTELESAVRVKTDLTTMARGTPVNELAIKQEKSRIADIDRAFDKVMTFVRERDYYEPLVPDVFPGGTVKDINKAIAFRQAYARKTGEWLRTLNAGTEPTPEDIQAEEDRLEAQANVESLSGDPEANEKPAMSPEVSAAIGRAREIYCYASPETFQESEISAPGGPMDAGGPPPSLEQMWRAQLEVWVQESVVTAIAEVNNSAADGLRRKQIDPWVGNLPIKDVRSIQTSQYYVKEGLPQESSKSDKDRAYPSADKAEAFTGRESDDLFELMHFAVRLVVDARDLPQVLAGLSAQRFHVPLSIRYEKLEPNVAMEGQDLRRRSRGPADRRVRNRAVLGTVPPVDAADGAR